VCVCVLSTSSKSNNAEEEEEEEGERSNAFPRHKPATASCLTNHLRYNQITINGPRVVSAEKIPLTAGRVSHPSSFEKPFIGVVGFLCGVCLVCVVCVWCVFVVVLTRHWLQ